MTSRRQTPIHYASGMIDEIRMRQRSPKTQDVYLRIAREFAGFRGRSPDTATIEDPRRYQLHLVNHGTSPVSLNHAITGLKFFFEVTLDRPDLTVGMHPERVPRARFWKMTMDPSHERIFLTERRAPSRRSFRSVFCLSTGAVDERGVKVR